MCPFIGMSSVEGASLPNVLSPLPWGILHIVTGVYRGANAWPLASIQDDTEGSNLPARPPEVSVAVALQFNLSVISVLLLSLLSSHLFSRPLLSKLPELKSLSYIGFQGT